MAMQTAVADDAQPAINVTPMIDVLLVLLVIFMAITPTKPTRFKANVPAEPDEQINEILLPNPNLLQISIAKDGKVKLNDEDMGTVDQNRVQERLTAVFADRDARGVRNEQTQEIEKTVFVKAPRTLPYGQVVRLIDAAKGAGAEPIGMQIDALEQ